MTYDHETAGRAVRDDRMNTITIGFDITNEEESSKHEADIEFLTDKWLSNVPLDSADLARFGVDHNGRAVVMEQRTDYSDRLLVQFTLKPIL